MNSSTTSYPPALEWPLCEVPSAPPDGVVQVWSVSLWCRGEIAAEHCRVLSAEEVERANRFRTEMLRRRYVLSRIALRRILAGCLGLAPDAVMYERADEQGKPRLGGASGLEFNLSHSGDLMLIAIGSRHPVGVDVEQIRPVKSIQSLATRFFTPLEAAWLQQKSGDNLEQGFFRIWTRKEAFLKATGEGIGGGLQSVEVLDGAGQFSDGVTRQGSPPATMSVIELHPADGYVGALAVSPDVHSVETWRAGLDEVDGQRTSQAS